MNDHVEMKLLCVELITIIREGGFPPSSPNIPDSLIRATKDTDRLILIGHMSSHQYLPIPVFFHLLSLFTGILFPWAHV